MATTVQSKIANDQDLVPFYYLRITGFPFYVFATVNPADARYGSFAWSAPTGFPSTWAQRGLQLPDEAIDQKFPDIIGGVATPGRTKLSVIDFPDPLHVGKGFFARLFAPGRAVSDTSLAQGDLANDVSPVPGADSVIEVSGQTGAWTVPSDVYLGAETIGITSDAPGGTGEHELAFTNRNKYVCYGNRQDGGSYWPPDPYHLTASDSTGALTTAPRVTAEAVDTLGRTAALWMGHMRPDGNPEPETSSTCLLLGRITDIGIGKIGGMFDLTVESIVADLSKGKIAPDLAHATIQDGFYLQSAAWGTFYIFNAGLSTITVTPGTYASPQILANEINTKLAAAGQTFVTCQLVVNGDGAMAFAFVSKNANATLYIGSVPINTTNNSMEPNPTSLLYAMGFDPTIAQYQLFDSGNSTTIPAPRAAARVFVPCYNNSADVNLVEANAAERFFTDPGDGTGQAWARFSDGQLVKLNGATGGSTNQVSTGGALGISAYTKADDGQAGFGRFYYVEPGTTPTIDQVILYSSLNGGTDVGSYTRFLGRLLASTKGHTSGGDGLLNVYPQFVGLGWNVLLTTIDWLPADESGTSRVAYIDNATKWVDLFQPYAREHGLFLIWDPSTSKIALRRITIPQAASVGSNPAFSESNRAKESDRTSQKVDRTSLRTSWKIQPGFTMQTVSVAPSGWAFARAGATATANRVAGGATALVINDTRARSMYPNDDRQEEIADSTLFGSEQISDVIQRLVLMYGTPWTLCSRTMNKRGMLLAPGSIHQVIDNTLINPFTGAAVIASTDSVYAFLTRVACTPKDGSVTIEFVINSTDDQSLYRPWSPTALVDISLNTGGFTRGYNSSTKALSTVLNYGAGSTSGAALDASSFAVGDTVRIITRDNSDGTATSSQTDTIASFNDEQIILTTGISALSAVSETIVVLQKYNSATSSRKTGSTKVAWQGDGDTKVIQGSSTARLNRWS